MKSRLHLSFATLTLILLVGGCKTLTISVSDTNPPVFSFSVGQFAECCDHLAFLTVSEVPDEHRDRKEARIIWQIWPISGTDNSARGLPKITYGQVPPGFVQMVPEAGPPPRLEEGKVYEASGPRIEVPDAYVSFRIQNGKVIQISGK